MTKYLLALLAIAFSWAHKVGEWKHTFAKPLRPKKHGRPEQSLFRYGLDHLTNHVRHGFRAPLVDAVFMASKLNRERKWQGRLAAENR